jgi:hypothetical protein
MIRTPVIILSMLVSALAAQDTDNSLFERKFKVIAIAPTSVKQVYISPELDAAEDLELMPENQIRLYEELGDYLCRILNNGAGGEIKFLGYDDIKSRLADTHLWDQFIACFSGEGEFDAAVAAECADQLQAEGIITSKLLFSYYAHGSNQRLIEAYFEWALVDLLSGQKTTEDSYSDTARFADSDPEFINAEFACFARLADRFISYFDDYFDFENTN